MKRGFETPDDGGSGGKRQNKIGGPGKAQNKPNRRGPSHVGEGEKRKKPKKGRDQLSCINLAIKVGILLRFVFLKIEQKLCDWICETEVLRASSGYRAESKAFANRMLLDLKGDDKFLKAGEEATKLAKAGHTVWSVESAIRAMLTLCHVSCLSEEEKKALPSVYVNFSAPKLPSSYKPESRFTPTVLLGDDGRVFAKSPNFLLEVAGFPPGLKADKFYYRGHCAFNCWLYIIQIVLIEGLNGLFRELVQQLEAQGYMRKMVDALYLNRGTVSLESEKARTQAIFQKRLQIMEEVQKEVTLKKTTVNVWGSKGYKIQTMNARIYICRECGEKQSCLDIPNPNREDFFILTGQKNPEVVKFCAGRCLADRPHIVKYVVNPHGIFVDVSNELKLSKNIEELLQPFRQTEVLKGNKMRQIAINAVELFVDRGYSHAFVLKRNEEGILMEYNDNNTEDLCTPFKVEGRKNPLALNGVLYGSETPAVNMVKKSMRKKKKSTIA